MIFNFQMKEAGLHKCCFLHPNPNGELNRYSGSAFNSNKHHWEALKPGRFPAVWYQALPKGYFYENGDSSRSKAFDKDFLSVQKLKIATCAVWFQGLERKPINLKRKKKSFHPILGLQLKCSTFRYEWFTSVWMFQAHSWKLLVEHGRQALV